MLVLSRQRDETIMIGDDVEITVVDIRGDKVRLGITAPSKIAVHRKEVYEAIKAENQQAARAVDADADSIRRSLRPGQTKAPSRPAARNGPGPATTRLTAARVNDPRPAAQQPPTQVRKHA